MRLHINPDGTKIMDWDGQDPEVYTDSLSNLIASLLEKKDNCKYALKNNKNAPEERKLQSGA